MKKSDLDPIASEQRRHLKEASNLPWSKRFLYYLDYFKVPAIISVACILFFAILIKTIFFAPPTILAGDFINAPNESVYTDDELKTAFLNYASDTAEDGVIYFCSTTQYDPDNYIAASRMLANLSAGESDFIICNEDDFRTMADNGFLMVLSKILPAGMLSQTGRLIYHDFTANDKSDDDNLGNVALGYDVTDSPILAACGSFEQGKTCIFCFPVNSTRTDAALTFLDWILHGSF